jgi:hypothetical protein
MYSKFESVIMNLVDLLGDIGVNWWILLKWILRNIVRGRLLISDNPGEITVLILLTW